MAEPLISLTAASKRTNISERTLRRLISDGRLPAVRIGDRLIRIEQADLDALMRPIPTAGSGQREDT